ncbi:glycosyltransferase [Coleofasciculus sp. E2-BRE-01]|uniref:glycosyltransferase n=1 Tax=Coleofasciculus sp. E2-BRE-01 TaxID=3069524 RepID=UPI0032FA2960
MKVTVVIPVYNGSKFLQNAIDSVVKQSYSDDIYIIVVNDGSTDNTAGILRSYENQITVFTKENGGTSDAWNYVLPLIETEYVFGLDADDEFIPETVSRVMQCLSENPESDLIYSDFVFIDAQGQEQKIVQNPDCTSPQDAIQRLIKLYDRLGQANNFLPFGHVRLYKIASLLKINGYDTRYKYAEDFDLVLRLAEAGFIFQRVNGVLYRYRWHTTNKGITNRLQQKEEVRFSVKLFSQRNKESIRYDRY